MGFEVASGNQLLGEGNISGAIAWYADALDLDRVVDANDRGREEAHRRRLAAALSQMPRIGQSWFHDAKVVQASFSPDGQTVMSADDKGSIKIWKMGSDKPLFQAEQAEIGDAGKETARNTVRATVMFDRAGKRVLGVGVNRIPGDGAPLNKPQAKVAMVWDVGSKVPAHVLEHKGDVFFAAFVGDGTRVVTAGEDDKVFLWDLADRSKPKRDLSNGSTLKDIETSADGKWLALAWDGVSSAESSLAIWQLEGEPRELPSPTWRSTKAGFADPVALLTFHPRGDLLLTCRRGEAQLRAPSTTTNIGSSPGSEIRQTPGLVEKSSARLWDVKTGAERGILANLQDKVVYACFSPTSDTLITLGETRQASVWRRDVSAAPPANDSLRGGALDPQAAAAPLMQATELDRWTARSVIHAAPIHWAAFSPDGRLFATASNDGMVGVWDALTLQPRTPFLQHGDAVSRVEFSPDCGWLLTASQDGTVRVWDLAQPAVAFSALKEAVKVQDLALSPDGRLLALANGDCTLWICKPDGRLVFPPLPLQEKTTNLWFSADGSRLLTLGEQRRDGRVLEVWDVRAGKREARLDVGTYAADADLYSPDARLLVQVVKDVARVWNIKTAERVFSLEPGESIYHVVFSPDGQRIAMVTNKLICVWDVATGRSLFRLEGHPEALKSRFSPDGRFLVTFAEEKRVVIWDLAGGTRLREVPHHVRVKWAQFDPSGKQLLVLGEDFSLWLRDLASGAVVAGPYPHPAFVNSVAFSTDGALLATACADNRARVWWRFGEDSVPRLFPHAQMVSQVALPSGSSKLITASNRRLAQVWDLETRALPPRVDLIRLLRSEYGTITSLGRRLQLPNVKDFAQCWPDYKVSALASARAAATGAEIESDWRQFLEDEQTNFGSALWHLDRLIGRTPGDGGLLARRVPIAQRQENYDQALDYWDKASRAVPPNPLRPWDGASLYRMLGDSRRKNLFASTPKATSVKPRPVDLNKLGDITASFRKAQEFLDQAPKGHPLTIDERTAHSRQLSTARCRLALGGVPEGSRRKFPWRAQLAGGTADRGQACGISSPRRPVL